MKATEAIIRAGATARLTQLVVDDEITRDLRDFVADRWPGSKAEYLVNCPVCVSVWAGTLAAVLPLPAASALAFSSGTIGARWLAGLAESFLER